MWRVLMVVLFWQALACVVFAQARPKAPTGPSAQEEEALGLVAEIVTADTLSEKKEGLRRLAVFRFKSVAFSLVDMLETASASPEITAEVEWALVSMSELAVDPVVVALAEGRIPRSAALVVLKRLARQEPSLVAPLLLHSEPLVARSAALALALCGHPGKLRYLTDGYIGAQPAAQAAILQGVCNTDAKECRRILTAAFSATDESVQLAALGLARQFGDAHVAGYCVPLLHSNSSTLVRAALETLVVLGARGFEADLQILFDSAADDIKEQILQVMAQTSTKESFSFLRKVALRYSVRMPLGALAHKLHRQSAGRLVFMGDSAETLPVEGTVLWDVSKGSSLVLYNEEGFRVVVSGQLEIRCAGRRRAVRKISPEQFNSDGSLAISGVCPNRALPSVMWIRDDGQRVEAGPPGR